MKKINIYKVILFIFNCFICCLLWIFLFNPILSSLINRDEIYMPDLIGDYKSDALKKLKSKGFNVEIKDIPYREGFIPFTVHDVYPRAYTKVKKGRNVELIVYSDRRKIKAPSYIGLDIREAKNQVRLNNLKIQDEDIFYYFDDFDSMGVISRQIPKEGEYITEGDFMSFWVCSGKPPNEYIVPDVVGKSLKYALGEFRKRGFLVGEVKKIVNDDYLEDTVYAISYISSDGYSVEVIEGIKYTAPIKVDITVTKNGE
mgnify:CR=1 FL=1